MGDFKITFEREGKEFQASEGMTILEAMIAAGLEPNAPCGGAGKCGKCKVKIPGGVVLACQAKIHSDLTVETEVDAKEKAKILMDGVFRPVDFRPGDLPAGMEHPLLAAVDLGSTSIVCYLHDGKDGRQLGVKSTLNPQRQYGGDVVMRASYAMEKGASVLSSCVRESIDRLLAEIGIDRPGDRVSGFPPEMLQKLVYTRFLVAAPSVLFIEKPFAEIDMHIRETTIGMIKALLARGITVILLMTSPSTLSPSPTIIRSK